MNPNFKLNDRISHMTLLELKPKTLISEGLEGGGHHCLLPAALPGIYEKSANIGFFRFSSIYACDISNHSVCSMDS
jgi:hypothetical protein